ncbi:hypothetical protein AB0M45_27945 [Nocardia sp. NPDC051787]|uniref:hypothetical protein n=1 Tax=Nocardia sp. NPDC051787 TaxID=3155415 RepID=UPI003429C7D9
MEPPEVGTLATRSRTTPRNWNVDVVRAFAIAVVVVVHWISVRVTGGGGAVRGDLTLHSRPIWALSWVLQVMPLFFSRRWLR